MNIVIFTQHFWPENFRINDIAYELNLRNKVCIITGLPNYPNGKIYKSYKSYKPKVSYHNNIKIIRLPIIPRFKGTSLNLIINYLSFIISGIFHINFLKKNTDPDVVFVYGTSPILQAIPALLFSKIKKVPLVLWIQDLWPESVKDTGFIKNNLFLLMINSLVVKIYKRSNKILLQSPMFIYHHNIKPFIEKCLVHYNPSEFRVFEKKEAKNIKSKIFNMVYAGNLGKAQNFDSLFDLALFSISNKINVRFTLIGEGSEKDNIQKRIFEQKLGNIINIQGPKSKDQLNEILSECDSLILTLNEGVVLSKTIPAKFQTYLFFSKPLFSISSGIVNDLINKHNLGIATKPNEKENLIQNFKKLYSYSYLEKKKIGENCYQFYLNHFEIEKNCEKLVNIFKEVTK